MTVCALATVLFVGISTSSSFLLNNDDTLSSLCFPQDQFCHCYLIYIEGGGEGIGVNCSAQNFTKSPNYTKISDRIIEHKKYDFWEIDMSDNQLTTISAGVFSHFNHTNTIGNILFLNFERNMISTIGNGAFIGINNMEIHFNLTDNRIAALPLDFQMLHDLKSLSLQGNPILAFDPAIVNSMAQSLSFLEVGYKALLSGNKELSVLNLTSITIYDVPSDSGNLTFNPFRFFRNTMEDLLIAGTELRTLPCFLIDAPNMMYFFLQDATNISAISVFDCQPGTSLKVLDFEIMFSGLEEFPDILKFTPSLLGLNLFHNKINSVNEKFIPLHNKLEVLNLSYNRLRTIPAIFSRFDHLKFLYIESNEISFVAPESNVLSIASLCATGNPWTHTGLNCENTYSFPFMYTDNSTLIAPKQSNF